jgi:hypothetical protein
LTPEDRTYLQTFTPLLELPLDQERRLLCYHGSPHSFDDVIAATTPDTEVQTMLAGYSATVLVGGHTHIQMLRRYQDTHLINVGSIGLPGVNAGVPELPLNRHGNCLTFGENAFARGEKQCSWCSQKQALSPDKLMLHQN